MAGTICSIVQDAYGTNTSILRTNKMISDISYEQDRKMHMYKNVNISPLISSMYHLHMLHYSFMMYLELIIFCFFLFFRAMAIMAATIATINSTTRAPTAPRMPPRRREEGLLVGVTVVGSVTVFENTGALMVPPTVVDLEETVSVMNTLK